MLGSYAPKELVASLAIALVYIVAPIAMSLLTMPILTGLLINLLIK
jgi:hypothetical protein